MTKSDKGDFLKEGKAKEIEKEIEDEEKLPQEWVCVDDCYCSDTGDPMRQQLWHSGDVCWTVKKPSQHFTTREEYNKGTDGRNKYFALYIKYGGNMTDELRAMPAKILKLVVDQKKREYMRKQATSS